MCCSKVYKIITTIFLICISFDAVQAQWSGSASVNTPVAIAASQQTNATIVSDGSGGHFVGWLDMRSGTQNIYLQHISSAGLPQWAANGIQVVSVDRGQSALAMVSDGAGGVILAWHENRADGTDDNVYAQRFNAAGNALWTADGVVVTGTGKQQSPAICSDGNNGIFICFNQPDSFNDPHMFGQWIDANGVVKWGTGVAVSTSTALQGGGVVIADGTGSAIYAWHDNRTFASGYNIYAQRISAAGNREWTNAGALVTGTNGADIWPSIISDGSTGAFIIWEKNINSGNFYGQHINNNGASLWAANGVLLLSGALEPKLTRDAGTGFHLTWRNADVRTQHYNSAGAVQWTAGGVVLTTGMANWPSDLSVVPDGAGGLYAAWLVFVNPTVNLYAQHVDNTGTIKFATGGILLSNAPGSNKNNISSDIRDGMAGAVFTWQDARSGDNDIYAQLLLPTGFPPEPRPTIQSFTPASGPAGTSVTITGYGFNTTTTNNIVYFDGMKATVTAATSTSLTVTVPAHTTYAQISVLNSVTNLRGRSRGFYSGSHTPVTNDLSKFDFLQAVSFSLAGGAATKIATADIDGNGKIDAVAFNSGSAWVSIFGNSSTAGTFGANGFNGGNMGLNTNGKAEHVSIGDLDNDGKPDLVISDWQNGKIYIYRNNSTNGNFSFGSTITLTSSSPFATAITDIDGDGKADIVAASIGSNNLTLFQNSSTPGNMTAASFSAPITKPVSGGNTINLIAAGDLDGDGKDDLLAGDGGSGQNKMYVLRNTHTTGAISSSSFGTALSFAVGASSDGLAAVKIVDMDMDGKPDIVGTSYTSASIVGIYRNIATSGTLTAGSFESLASYSSDAFPYDMTIGDIDGDSKPEIVISSIAANAISFFKNLSVPGMINAGSFSKTFAVDAVNGVTAPKTAALADMDGDGRAEILVPAGSGVGVLYQSPLLTPTSQATHLVFTNTTANSGTLGWTNGNGASRMVFVKTGATTGEPAPIDLNSYTPNSSVAFGGQIESSGWRAIYKGTGSTTTVNGLQPGGIYRIMVVELNDNGYTTGKYLSTVATGNPTTVSSPVEVTFIGTVNVATNNRTILDFMVGFSGSITGLTAANFALSTTGSISGASVLTVTGSGTTYGVSVATGTGDGTIRLDLVNGTGISAAITTPLPYEGSYYTIDKTGPTLSPVTLVSNNSLTATYARLGSTVTLRFTRPGETINNLTTSIAGTTVSTSNAGPDLVGTINVNAGVPEGPVTFSISVDDYLGNRTTVTQTTNGSFVIVDKTAPLFTAVSIVSDNASAGKAIPGNRVTLRFTSNETISPASITLAGQTLAVTNTGGNNWEGSRVLNTEPEGVLSFAIRVNDLAGNASQTVIATTNSSSVVFDKTAPALNTVTIASGNIAPSRARVGDVVSINFTASEGIATPTLTIATHNIIPVNTTGNAWVGVYTMTAADAAGFVPFSIAFTDQAGNAGATTIVTTNSSNVLFDKTAPALNTVTIASGNVAPSKARVGDVVSINFTASEGIATPALTIATHNIIPVNTTGNAWVGVYTMTAADAAGFVPFSIAFTDQAGNAGATTIATTNSSNVLFDKTAPVVNTVTIASGNSVPSKARVGDVVSINFTASESITTPTLTIATHNITPVNTTGNAWVAVYTMTAADAEGFVPFSIAFTDLAGNAGATTIATTNSSNVLFDKTAPVVNTVTIASGNSVPSMARVGDVVRINFTASESITTPTLTIATHNITPVNTTGNAWVAVYTMTAADAEGFVPFSIAFTDLAGNAGATTIATTNSSHVLFDRTAPALNTVTIASGNIAPAKAMLGDVVRINFTSSEGITTPTLTIATHNVTPVNTTGNAWTAVYTMTAAAAEGPVPFSIAFSDLAGNAGATTTATTNNSSVTFTKNTTLRAALTRISFASGNPEPSKAKTGDRVTLNFVSDVSLADVTATIATHAITPVNITGNTWAATYTMTTSDIEGKIPFTIAAANLAVSATGTTDNSNVWFDRTLPVVTSINRQSPATANVVGGPLVYRIQFTEPVTGVEKRNFRLNKTATADAAIDTIIKTNDSTYDVRLIRTAGTGTLRLDLDTTGNIADSAGNLITTKFSTGQQYNVAVPSNSMPAFVAGPTATLSVCQNATALDLSDLLKTTDADNGQTLTWNISSNAANGMLGNFPGTALSNGSAVTPPSVVYTPSLGFNGIDQFVIKVSDGTDSALIAIKITVYGLPSENITAVQGTILCGPNATLPLTIANGSSFSWTRNGSLLTGNTNQLTVNAAGTYAAIVTDANGCVAATGNSVVVTTAQQPKAAFAYAGYCVNIPVSITNQSTGTSSLSYQWSDGNGNTSTAVQPSFTYAQPGNYTIKLKVSSSTCSWLPDSLSQVIAVERPTPAIRMTTISAQTGQQVQLQARTFGTGYQWTPANDLTNSAIANPVLRARAEQQYTVSIRSAGGCTTVDTVLVKVFENTVYVPRVFTPNGDGNNDVLYFNYINVRKLDYVRIYNRQGKLVWESSNMAEGWDGKFNGILQPLETYTWLIRATDIFGLPVNRQGNITLLR